MDYIDIFSRFIDYWLRYFIHAWEKAHWVDKGFVIYFTVLGILWFFVDDDTPITTPPKQKPSTAAFPNQRLLISKAGYVREVISWCSQHLGVPGRGPKVPDVSVSYYPHKKRHGNYVFRGKKICIYVNNHESIKQLTDTIIHEYVHFLEIRSKEHQKAYNIHLEQIGYQKNPYEVSARKQAALHVEPCLRDMRRLGYLS